MNAIKTLREQYGITQQQLADYLSVSKGLISMVEKGKRQLPVHTLVKLALLEQPITTQAIGTAAQKQATLLQTQAVNANKALQTEILQYKISIAITERQLASAIQKYTQAIHTLQLVAQLRLSIVDNDKKGRLWLNMMEALALKQANIHGEKSQLLLQLKLEGVQQQATLAQQWLAKKNKKPRI